jgi:hypothetical protein
MGNAPVDVRVKQLSLKVVRVLEILLCVLLICGIVVEGGHIALALPTLSTYKVHRSPRWCASITASTRLLTPRRR